jgi:hypothetical protein
MKKLLLSAVASCLFLFCTAQTDVQIETMMTRRVLRCDDIQLNLFFLLPDLYKQGKHSSIKAVLDYADKKCPYRGQTLSFEALYAIELDSFQLSNYNPNELSRELEYYLKRVSKDSAGSPPYYLLVAPDSETLAIYYATVSRMATSMAGRQFKTDFEASLVNFYIRPTDSMLQKVDKELTSKRASNAYYEGQRYRRGHHGGLHMSLYGGVWVPHGNLSAVGRHGYIGLQYGMGTRKFQVSASIAARFLNAADSFNVLKGDSLYRSRNYGGAYFGLDVSYALVRGKHHEWSVLGGFGLETLMALNIEKDDDDDNITKRLYTPNINVGTGYKFWLNGGYVALDLKYNVLFFRNKGGTNFSGNVFTLGVAIGFVVD